jgi:hypothetical protein
VWSRAAGLGGPRARESEACCEAGWWSPRTRELLLTRCFYMSPGGLSGATAPRRWVLHSNGPFGVVVPAPPFLLCSDLHFSGFSILVLRGWSCGFALFFCRR